MTRRKVDRGARLSRIIALRVSDSYYKRMQEMVAKSNCQTVGELARSILYHEKVNWYHVDARLESTAVEVAGIKRELNAIGRNINQITHHFHTANEPRQKMYDALKVAQEYKKVEAKVDQLLRTTSPDLQGMI
jgi:hypothetical protein